MELYKLYNAREDENVVCFLSDHDAAMREKDKEVAALQVRVDELEASDAAIRQQFGAPDGVPTLDVVHSQWKQMTEDFRRIENNNTELCLRNAQLHEHIRDMEGQLRHSDMRSMVGCSGKSNKERRWEAFRDAIDSLHLSYLDGTIDDPGGGEMVDYIVHDAMRLADAALAAFHKRWPHE